MTRRPLLLLACLLAGLAAGLSAPVAAQAPRTEAEIEAATRQLASELRCPVCQGVSIQDSPTELAQEMKAVIRGRLEGGETPAEVRAYFVDRYGEWILLRPEPQGFNLVVYVLPVVGLLLGGGLVFRTVRRWTQPADPRAAAGAAPGDDGVGSVEAR